MMGDKKRRNYKVGYGKPPVEHRFPKGVSGNRLGRPLGAKARVGGHPMDSGWQKAWLEGAAKKVPATLNGRRVLRSLGQLVVDRTLADAAAGKPTAMRIANQKLSEAERVRRERHKEEIETMGALYRSKSAELAARLAAGEIDPLVFPHPEDFVFNHDTGMVDIVGPTDMQQHKAAMVLVELCLPLVALLDNHRFTRADDPDRLRAIDELSTHNALLPPRLQQWPRRAFVEDYELFPEACLRNWVLNGIKVRTRR